ncbi:DUF1697 domain-containing protein [Paenibacillus sp. HWE-109]|uniref:DUF1697 domain-containing protein n=1 Tax=Paenibacillus sp. HWE-109 TaxID=1306526 RepID=UPI001EDF0C0C|nr:DUF1697 domain-containing protein [Paenibacillus sp. HWE-109]UKS29146.1 DUF1697 domain-containing protein [Paenibacillus sp. HWE-109]
MPRYMALLRGINVSGQKLIKMDKLRSIFEAMGYQRVITYIQSGNVIFDSEESAETTRERIVQELLAQLNYDIPVIIRSLTEMHEIVEQTPYLTVDEEEGEQRYVTLLSQLPTDEAVEKLASFQNEVDEFRVIGLTVYMLIRKNYGETKFSNNFLEKKLGVTATTRNWQTMNKLIQLAEEGS